MTEYKVGDLVQFKATKLIMQPYRKMWDNKIGVVVAVRAKTEVAYIKWCDLDANDIWIRYDSLQLLNREYK